ncbi:TIGR04255 family protein [Ferruginibacter sp.]|nr:TIGR04255 family protein [Ferruginibacter sp.]
MSYSTNFLSQVIFQANFQIASLDNGIHPILAALCKEKTGVDVTKQNNRAINILPTGGAETKLHSRWTFLGKKLHIVIQSDLLQVITLKYTSYEDYHPIISDIFNKVKEIYNPIVTRIALRYVNNISFEDGSTFEFETLIKPVLLNATLEYKDFGLTRSIGVMNMFNSTENINTNFTYGFVNPQFPSKITKRHFVLDFDCSMNLNVVIDSIKPLLLKLREQVNTLFEKSILEDLRTKMK